MTYPTDEQMEQSIKQGKDLSDRPGRVVIGITMWEAGVTAAPEGMHFEALLDDKEKLSEAIAGARKALDELEAR